MTDDRELLEAAAECPHCGKPLINCKCWGEVRLQYGEALHCLSSVMRAANHALVGMAPSEKEAKLRAVLSKAHDWYMAEVNSDTYMGEPAEQAAQEPPGEPSRKEPK